MYLRFTRRLKDGKEHRYWSIVESRRCAGGRVVQRPVLYLGEINDSQREAWCRVIEGFDEGTQRSTQLALFPAERAVPEHAKAYGVQVRLEAMQLHRPGNGGPAGWPASCTRSLASTSSGQPACRTRARAPAGGMCCRRWCAIG
jgi:hypothetical protein